MKISKVMKSSVAKTDLHTSCFFFNTKKPPKTLFVETNKDLSKPIKLELKVKVFENHKVQCDQM